MLVSAGFLTQFRCKCFPDGGPNSLSMACDEIDVEIAWVLTFLLRTGWVILDARDGRFPFAGWTGHGPAALVADFPQPLLPALVETMRAEGLIGIVWAEWEMSRVAYAPTAEGCRVAPDFSVPGAAPSRGTTVINLA